MKSIESKLRQAADAAAKLHRLPPDMRALVCIEALEELEREHNEHHAKPKRTKQPKLRVLDGGKAEPAKKPRKYTVTPKVLAARKRAAAKAAKRAKAGS